MTVFAEYLIKPVEIAVENHDEEIDPTDITAGYENLAKAEELLKTVNYSLNIRHTLATESIKDLDYLKNLNTLGVETDKLTGYEAVDYLNKMLDSIIKAVIKAWKALVEFIKKIGKWIVNLFKSKKTIPDTLKEEIDKVAGLLEHKDIPVKGLPDKGFTDEQKELIAKHTAILKFVYGGIDYGIILDNLNDIRDYINRTNAIFGLTKMSLQRIDKINVESSIDFIKTEFSNLANLKSNIEDVKAKDMLRGNTPELFSGQAVLLDMDEAITPSMVTQKYYYVKTDIAEDISNRIKIAKSEQDWIEIYKILLSSVQIRTATVRAEDVWQSALSYIAPLPIDQIYAINEKYREAGTKAYKTLKEVESEVNNTYNALSKLYNKKTKDTLEKLVLQYELKTVMQIKAQQTKNIVLLMKELARPSIAFYVKENLSLFKGMLYDETKNPYL